MSTIKQKRVAQLIIENATLDKPLLGEYGITPIVENHYKSNDSGVYIIKVNEYYKIGYTEDFNKRLGTFKNANKIY